MIKGHTYDEQLFYSVAFRNFIRTFLNNQDGIISDIGNACEISNTNNTITVRDGLFVVQGGFIEVKEEETLSVALANAYCKLVFEIDMSKTNTEQDFAQGIFKILTGTNNYPQLTQQKLAEDSGIYQFEFAQFRTTTSGITDFTDKRTYIDFEGIYKYVGEIIDNILDGSIYRLKTDYTVIEDSMTINASSEDGNLAETAIQVNYPDGFSKDNCAVISIGRKAIENVGYSFDYRGENTLSQLAGGLPTSVVLQSDKIEIIGTNMVKQPYTLYYKIVLMKN